jgi:16S rRNA (cytosine967-C5)-methyltransferase
LLARASQDTAAHYLLPDWLLAEIQKAWPDNWQSIARELNQPPPLTLRVNLKRISREAYRQKLSSAGIGSSPHLYAPAALTLEQAVNVDALPGFVTGDVSVQDAGAQLASPLLKLEPGLRVLDACAAPGGKTLHLLELAQGNIDVTALDVDESRLERVRENLARSGDHLILKTADASDPETWWDGEGFDRILLDVPCSATGVIRRHPDIKRHRQPEDIDALVKRQAEMLQRVWRTLKPKGLLLYVTCSILPRENSEQIVAFLQNQADAQEVPLTVGWGLVQQAGRQVLPGEDGMDGFYFALLRKTGEPSTA